MRPAILRLLLNTASTSDRLLSWLTTRVDYVSAETLAHYRRQD